MAALLCNRVVPYSRIFVRNKNGKSLFSDVATSKRLLNTTFWRYCSQGVHGEDTKKMTEAPETQQKSQKDYGDINEKEVPAEDDPYAPFPDDVNPVTGEKGGPKGPEPTRYGDWERKGRCIDF